MTAAGGATSSEPAVVQHTRCSTASHPPSTCIVSARTAARLYARAARTKRQHEMVQSAVTAIAG